MSFETASVKSRRGCRVLSRPDSRFHDENVPIFRLTLSCLSPLTPPNTDFRSSLAPFSAAVCSTVTNAGRPASVSSFQQPEDAHAEAQPAPAPVGRFWILTKREECEMRCVGAARTNMQRGGGEQHRDGVALRPFIGVVLGFTLGRVRT